MNIQFFEDRLQVPFDGVGRDKQFLCNFLVRKTLRQQIENFTFAVSQCIQLAEGLTHHSGLFHHTTERGAIKGSFFNVGGDEMLGIDPLDLLRLRDATDHNCRYAFGTGTGK